MTTTPSCTPFHLNCLRTRTPMTIDGSLDKAVWRKAFQSQRFVDMTSGSPGWFNTRAAALWDDQNFYVAFWVEEPFVEAYQAERDSIVFRENDVEVFIDAGDCYYEFEINALNAVYEVFFIWRDAFGRGTRFDTPEFDLYTRKVYSFGGDYDRTPAAFWDGTHPRKTRWAFLDWDFPGLKTAVKVDGTLNDNSDIDRGWTVEIAFPWNGMGPLAHGRACPPNPGDAWRMFFGRFEKLNACGQEVNPHPAWAMNAHGIPDTHQPQCFSFVDFSGEFVEDQQE
jgi:hypothetical protein